MERKSCAKVIGIVLIVISAVALFGCFGPAQRVKMNTSEKMNDEASLNIYLNKQGKFYFADKDGKPDENTIPFDEVITRSKKRWDQKHGKDEKSKWELKKIQSIEVYRASGSFDFIVCIDNECSCRRYNNYGQYCCACNCNCTP